MNALKQKHMMAVYNGFRGDATVADITSRIPAALLDVLTGAQLGHVMNAINKAYHDGRASTGAEVIDGNPNDGMVYVNCLNSAIEWMWEGRQFTQREERTGSNSVILHSDPVPGTGAFVVRLKK